MHAKTTYPLILGSFPSMHGCIGSPTCSREVCLQWTSSQSAHKRGNSRRTLQEKLLHTSMVRDTTTSF